MNKIEIIKKVTEDNDCYYIDLKGSWSFMLYKKYNVIPKIGNKVILYLTNNTTIRGIDINGVNVFYKSDEELEIDNQRKLMEYEQRENQEFEKNKDQMDKDYESLPDNFKKRIDGFRKNPSFRKSLESYELFCCKEALKIVESCKTNQEIKDFYNMSYDEQINIVPTLSKDHSGNTMSFACLLAQVHISHPDKIHEIHGALAAFVGSKSYN